jgi:hypothetical protein
VFAPGGTEQALKALRQELGEPILTYEIDMTPGTVAVLAIDREQPRFLTRYRYHRGAVSAERVGLRSPLPSLRFFSVADLPIERLPQMVADLKQRVGAPRAIAVSVLVLSLLSPGSPAFVITINDVRMGRATAIYDVKGKLVPNTLQRPDSQRTDDPYGP